jgi:hypothetical protein
VPSANVAVACCRRSPDAGAEDLYPGGDAGPLCAALAVLGAEARLLSWDDPAASWASFSHVVLSSTWDCVDRPDEYLGWIRSVGAVTTLVNPVEIVTWNLDKVHQRDLAADGVPVIPTIWVTPRQFRWPAAAREIVIKPSISAGGRDTARYAAGDGAALTHARRLLARGQTVMVQEYLPRIDDEGEVDLIFFGGAFSHAVGKQPSLQVGEGVIERAWERTAWSGLVTPTPEQLNVAGQALASIVRRFGRAPLYARVDLVGGHAGQQLVLEVELIDPYLSLDLQPTAALRFAELLIAS